MADALKLINPPNTLINPPNGWKACATYFMILSSLGH